MTAVLVFIFVFFLLVVNHTELLEEQALKYSSIVSFLMIPIRVDAVITKRTAFVFFRLYLILVGDDLYQFNLLDNLDAFLLKHILDFCLNLFIFEGVWVDHGQIFLKEIIRLVVLIDVTFVVGDAENY